MFETSDYEQRQQQKALEHFITVQSKRARQGSIFVPSQYAVIIQDGKYRIFSTWNQGKSSGIVMEITLQLQGNFLETSDMVFCGAVAIEYEDGKLLAHAQNPQQLRLLVSQGALFNYKRATVYVNPVDASSDTLYGNNSYENTIKTLGLDLNVVPVNDTDLIVI
ncbi:MAG TPA: hypothetical protein PLL26_06025 [Candidatus Dojkabacteria bacterium]|nr:hypothetical protein [Candidatus Dojkabacteria bacterium]